MPLESITCTHCGSSDVQEVKAGTYFCAHCDGVFKHIDPSRVDQSMAPCVTCGSDSVATCPSCGQRVCNAHMVLAAKEVLSFTASMGLGMIYPVRLTHPVGESFIDIRPGPFRTAFTAGQGRCFDCRVRDAMAVEEAIERERDAFVSTITTSTDMGAVIAAILAGETHFRDLGKDAIRSTWARIAESGVVPPTHDLVTMRGEGTSYWSRKYRWSEAGRVGCWIVMGKSRWIDARGRQLNDEGSAILLRKDEGFQTGVMERQELIALPIGRSISLVPGTPRFLQVTEGRGLGGVPLSRTDVYPTDVVSILRAASLGTVLHG